MSNLKKLAVIGIGAIVLTACASGRIKARKEERDRVASTSHLYCDFVNGEVYPDVEVALNLEMAKHCDSKGQLSMTNYRSPSDAVGLVYCCASKDVTKEASVDTGKDANKHSAKTTTKDLGSLKDTPDLTDAEKK